MGVYDVVFLRVTPPSLSVSHGSVAPINLKTHLGLPWSNQKLRGRKPLLHPLLEWQRLQTQALCLLSKRRALDPARPPTHLRMRTMKSMKKEAMEEQLHPQWRPPTHGTTSLRHLRGQVQRSRPEQEVHPVLPAQAAQRARKGQPLGFPPNRLLGTKVGLIKTSSS